MEISTQQQKLCIWLTLSAALILLSQVESLPIDTQHSSEDGFLTYLDSLGTLEDGEDGAEVRNKRMVSGLGSDVDPESLTAGDLIYLTYIERVPEELHNWLFEMDIVKSSTPVRSLLGEIDGEEERAGHKQRRTAGTQTEYIWPEGRIPYVFDSSVSPEGRSAALRGMHHWMEHTCLQFVPRESGDNDYIEFVEHEGCWSYIGRRGGVQPLSLGRGPRSYCKSDGVVLHELGHAEGLWHEQSRPDRDRYIRIHWENVELGAENSFRKYNRSIVQNFSLPYDYGSIMHYPAYAFSWNDRPTIVPLSPGVSVMGQRKSLSPLDIKAVNTLYNCQTTNRTKDAVNTSNVIPKDAFLILNSHTQTCLDVSNRTTDWTSPIMDQHVYTGLYYVALKECTPDSRDQFWHWTSDGGLLHLGTFLCLTALNSEYIDTDVFVTDLLVLMHCRGGDPRQQWVCAGDFIENPQLGKCILASSDTDRKQKREANSALLDEIAQELASTPVQTRPPSRDHHNFQVNLDHRATLSDHSTTASISFCEQVDTNQTWCAVSYTGEQNSSLQVSPSLCSSNSNTSHEQPACYAKDMSITAGLAFYYAKWVGCSELGYYVTGFYHSDQISGNGATAVLTGINCCMSGSVFTGQPNAPPPIHEEECVDIHWWNWLENTLISEGWFSCPRGMFLKSFLLTSRPYTLGHVIWRVKCCKPQSSPVVYEHCYKDYGKNVATDTGVHRCSLEGYHVTGMYKKGCSEGSEECGEEIMCCMALGV